MKGKGLNMLGWVNVVPLRYLLSTNSKSSTRAEQGTKHTTLHPYPCGADVAVEGQRLKARTNDPTECLHLAIFSFPLFAFAVTL